MWRDIEDAAVSRKAPLGAAKFNADEGEFYRWLKAFMVEVQTLCANVKLDLSEDVEEEQDEEDGDRGVDRARSTAPPRARGGKNPPRHRRAVPRRDATRRRGRR